MKSTPHAPALIALLAVLGCAPASTTRVAGSDAPRESATRANGPPVASPGVGAVALPPTLFDAAIRLPAPELEHRGAAAVGLALRRVGPTQRVLMIGAHPDDENSAILAELALGRGADVAYLSLTRGEGGQNIIGGEFEEALGLLRTEELLAARRLDGAVQFFSRAYDFGFSRSAEETFRHWPRDSVLADVVAIIRAWRPDVVISQFTGTASDGHGHHQAAGILAREAYLAAADSGYAASGASALPHDAERFYQSWFRPIDSDSAIRLETGRLDPLLGRSHYQIAMASRSRHRSQEMGRGEPPGPHTAMLSAVEPGPLLAPADVFEDLPATLMDRAAALRGTGAAAGAVLDRLRAYEAIADEAAHTYRPARSPGPTAALLAGAAAALDSAYVLAAALPDADAARLRFHIAAERADVARAATAAGGVVLDVVADRAVVSPGDTITLHLSLWNGGDAELRVSRLEPLLPEGWWAESDDPPVASVAPGHVARRAFRVHLPTDAAVDVPYFLERPRSEGGGFYAWPSDPDVRGRPFQPPLLRGSALVMGSLPIEAAAEHVTVDPARGEVREPVLVLPPAGVFLEPDVLFVPLDPLGAPRLRPRLERTVLLNRPSGRPDLAWTLPAGWSLEETPVPAVPVAVMRDTIELALPDRIEAGDYMVSFGAPEQAGSPAQGYTIVDHAHTRPRVMPRSRQTVVRAFPVAIPSGIRVAYVPGTGDATPSAIAALGAPIDTLRPAAIPRSDLSRYDVIVVGVRAYEVAPGLRTAAARERLERFAQAGGAVIVQYSQYEFAEDSLSLLPLTMDRPHDRVTDENAPVRLLAPEHPVLSAPNRITVADFDGWEKERGLFFAHTWDDAYTPLLEMADPGREPLRGGLLAARIGQGWYVYTGLSLFRQLPAGVPGAYRLLANLLALGAD